MSLRPRNAPQPADRWTDGHRPIGDRWTDGHRRFHELMGDKKELATLDTEELKKVTDRMKALEERFGKKELEATVDKLVDERVAAKVKELEARLLLSEERLGKTEAELIKIRATSEGGSTLTKKLQQSYESKAALEKLLSDDDRRGSSSLIYNQER